jgi:hypothetical protein
MTVIYPERMAIYMCPHIGERVTFVRITSVAGVDPYTAFYFETCELCGGVALGSLRSVMEGRVPEAWSEPIKPVQINRDNERAEYSVRTVIEEAKEPLSVASIMSATGLCREAADAAIDRLLSKQVLKQVMKREAISFWGLEKMNYGE